MFRKVKAPKRFLTQMFLTFLITVSFLVPNQRPSSAQNSFCPGNLLANGDFSTGLNVVGSGNFPPSTVPNWSAWGGTTPQISALPGCGGNTGFISMWGNKTVGEAIQQTLSTPLQVGRRYRVSLCVSWLNNNPVLPNYVRVNVRASIGSLTSYAGSGAQIGVTPNITSTQWTTITLPDWTATSPYNTITLNPENDNTANDGNTVSWVRLDNVCIREVPPDFEPVKACEGQPTTFTSIAPGANSWSWAFGDGTPNSAFQNPTHTFAAAGVYNVTLCVNGSTNCVTKPVTVNPKPPTPVITGPSSSCGALTAAYSVQATPGVSYSWSVSNGTINGPSTGSSVSVTWNANGGGSISVTATNKAGCSSFARMTISGCDLHLGECCLGFQSKTDMKSLTHTGGGVYNFIATLSVNQPNIIRVTANLISSSLTYSSPSCGTAGPVNGYVTSAQNTGSFTASVPISGGHEVIWYGPPANVGGLNFPMQIKFPPPPTGSCKDYLTFCVKYTFTDSKCRTCEVIRCYGPFKRGGPFSTFEELKEIDVKDIKVGP